MPQNPKAPNVIWVPFCRMDQACIRSLKEQNFSNMRIARIMNMKESVVAAVLKRPLKKTLHVIRGGPDGNKGA